jgi:hypothetical protein
MTTNRVCRPTIEKCFDSNILLDSLSCVDVMHCFGLDASAKGRLKYAADHGIEGEPFSPDWNDEIRRDVLRRNDAVEGHAPPWWFPLLAIFSPPAVGYQRIPYLCVCLPSIIALGWTNILQGCGEFIYVDVRELSAGGVDRFRQRLLASSRAVQTQEQTGSVPSRLQTPPQVHLRNVHATLGSRSTRYIPSGNRQSTARDSSQAYLTSPRDQDSKFLLLCINTKDSTALLHVEVASLTNDQQLFERISMEYQRARESSEFRVTSIIPQQLSKFLKAISAMLPKLPCLPRTVLSASLRYIHQMRLYRIESGDYVQVRTFIALQNFLSSEANKT